MLLQVWYFMVKETKSCWLSSVLMHLCFSLEGCLYMMIRCSLRPATLNQIIDHLTKKVVSNLEPCFCLDLIQFFFHLYTLIYFEIGQNVIYIQWLLHFHIISSVAHVNLHLHQFVVWAFVIMLCFINCINFTQSSTIGRFSLLYLFICVGGEGWDMFMQNLWWFAVKETKPCWLSGVLMHVHFSSWGCLCMMIRHVLRPAALNQTTYHFTKQVLGNLEPCFCFDLIHSAFMFLSLFYLFTLIQCGVLLKDEDYDFLCNCILMCYSLSCMRNVVRCSWLEFAAKFYCTDMHHKFSLLFFLCLCD